MKRGSQKQTAEHRIDENRAVAIVPIQRQQTAAAGLEGGSLLGQARVEGGISLADGFDPPFENIAHGRLSRLDAKEAGQDGTLHDAADAGNVFDLLGCGNNGAVAGRGADHLHQRAFADAAADSAVVDIHFADGHWNPGGQAERFGPCRRECAGGGVGIMGLVVETIPKLREFGTEQGQKLFVGQTAPLIAVKRLVAGRADAALDLLRILDPAEHRGNPVAHLNPRVSGLENIRRRFQAVPDFAPKPLGGISIAALGDVFGTVLSGEFRNACRFLPRSMVLPKPALRSGIFLPLRQGCEGAVGGIHRNRTRAGRVHTKANNRRRLEGLVFLRGGGQRTCHAQLQPYEIIRGMLPREVVVLGVNQHPVFS